MRQVFKELDVPWLPKPNFVEIIYTDLLSPQSLTKTVFVIPVTPDGEVVLANNLRRGIEASGGHIEPGETAEEAARREAMEEVGCEVGALIPIGYVRMNSGGRVPKDWKYPHPLGYQQFYAAPLIKQHPCGDYECGEPVYLKEIVDTLQPSARYFAARALDVIRFS